MFPKVDYWQECTTDCDDGDSEDERAGWVLAFTRATATHVTDGCVEDFCFSEAARFGFFFHLLILQIEGCFKQENAASVYSDSNVFLAFGCKIRDLVIIRKMKMSKVSWGGEAHRVAEDMSGPVMFGI